MRGGADHVGEVMRPPSPAVCCAALLAACVLAGAVDAQARRPRPARPGPIPGSELVVTTSDEGCDAPDQVDAGLVNVRLFNRGNTLRHVELIRLDRLQRIAELREYLLANDRNLPWMHALGGPAPASNGGTSSATMLLQPGPHVISCVFAGAPSVRQPFPDGVIKELTVTAAPGPARPLALPGAELSLRMFEWNFMVDGPLFAGRRTIRVENAGRLEHNVWIVRLLAGRTAEQAAAWISDPRGLPPFEAVGGTTELEADARINITVDLLPGDYVFLCTLYNPLSRRTHIGHGMMKTVRVVN